MTRKNQKRLSASLVRRANKLAKKAQDLKNSEVKARLKRAAKILKHKGTSLYLSSRG